MILLFKLLLTPLLIALVTLAGRRWGPAVSGWLVGLPLTSGPVALFLALDQGNVFASRAAVGTLLGLISVAGFCAAYSWLSLRFGWPITIVLSWAIFFLFTFALEQVSLALLPVFVLVVLSLLLTLRILPTQQSSLVIKATPVWDTPLRMLVATSFVLLLTGAAHVLGPQLSGLLTPFPLYATILAVFTHHFQNGAAARVLLRALITGLFTFAVFFLVIALSIVPLGIAPAFLLATLIALLLHGSELFVMRRRFMS